jgi:hypothetical protein
MTERIDVVIRFIDAARAKNLSLIGETLAENVVLKTPIATKRGKADSLRMLEKQLGQLADVPAPAEEDGVIFTRVQTPLAPAKMIFDVKDGLIHQIAFKLRG